MSEWFNVLAIERHVESLNGLTESSNLSLIILIRFFKCSYSEIGYHATLRTWNFWFKSRYEHHLISAVIRSHDLKILMKVLCSEIKLTLKIENAIVNG